MRVCVSARSFIPHRRYEIWILAAGNYRVLLPPVAIARGGPSSLLAPERDSNPPAMTVCPHVPADPERSGFSSFFIQLEVSRKPPVLCSSLLLANYYSHVEARGTVYYRG